MQLTETQSRALLAKHGVYVTEACDTCGQILGPIRFTRYGQKGEWCSRFCRDGVEHKAGVCRGCGASLEGKKKGTSYCDRTCRMRAVRAGVQNHEKIVNTPIQNKPLTDAILASGYTPSLEAGVCTESQPRHLFHKSTKCTERGGSSRLSPVIE